MGWFPPVVILLSIFAAVCVAMVQRTAPPSPVKICPHCQTKGQVQTVRTRHKARVSGGKATGAPTGDRPVPFDLPSRLIIDDLPVQGLAAVDPGPR